MLTGENVTLTGVSVTLTPGPATLTLTPGEPLIRLGGSLAITEPADTVADAAQPPVYRTNIYWQMTAEPPWLAESLLCIFARAKDIDGLMGDEQEKFAGWLASGMSERRAVARYWSRVIRTIGPQLWQAIKRVGLFGLIATLLRR